MKSRHPLASAVNAWAACTALVSLLGGQVVQAQSPAADQALAVPASDAAMVQRLTVLDFARMLARSDELVRAQAIEETIAGQGVRGAQAIYEPFLTTSLSREGRFLPTSAEEALARGSSASSLTTPFPYTSRVTQFKTAVGVKASSGADIELSYNLDAIVNSLQSIRGGDYISPEYKGSLGFSLTQPLMRNFGRDVTESGIRIAEREEFIARETVRQVTAQRVSEGLQTYLFVQRALERVRWRQRALDMATQLETEISRQQHMGLKSFNELTEARVGLTLRQAQLTQAEQEFQEQLNALQVYLSAQPGVSDTRLASQWMPADDLVLPEGPYADSLKMIDAETAFAQRPETRVNRMRIEREDLRSQFAKNQTEPDLSFRLRYGKESLTGSPLQVHEYLQKSVTPYNSWSIGLSLRIGLDGDAKKDSEYQAAMLRKSQAEMALGAAQQRITNELLGVKAVLERSMQLAKRQSEIVQAQSQLLAAERRMMTEGQKSLLDVLRREMELALAREALSDAITQVNRSSYLASQVNGGLLSRLGLE